MANMMAGAGLGHCLPYSTITLVELAVGTAWHETLRRTLCPSECHLINRPLWGMMKALG